MTLAMSPAFRKPANVILAFGLNSLGLARYAVSASASQAAPLSIRAAEYLKPSTAPASASTIPFNMVPVQFFALLPTRRQALHLLKTRFPFSVT